MNTDAPLFSRLFFTMGSVTGITVVTLAAYMVAVLLVGRNLSQEDFGYFTLWIYSVNLLGTGALLGYPSAILRHVSREELSRSAWPRVFRPLGALSILVGLAGAILFVVIYPATSWNAGFLFLAGVLIGISLLPVTLLQIFRRFVIAQGLFTLWRVILLAGVLILLAAGTLTLRFLFPVVAVGGLLQLLLAGFFLRRETRGEAPIPLRAMAPDAAVFSGLFLAAMLILRLDSFFLPGLLDFEALGLYSALSLVALTGYGVVSIAVGQVLRPKLASREPLPWRGLTVFIVGGGLVVGLSLAAISPWLLPLLFTDKYAGDHRLVFSLLVAAGVLQVLYAIPSSRIGILASSRVLRAYLLLSLTSLALDAVLLLWLVPRWGLVGAASATALVWLWRTSGAWMVSRHTT